MKLFDFLLRSSWITVAIAILTGFISGGSSAGLIAVISHALNPSTHGNMTSLLWSFCGLALISLLT
ncbi:MAG: ABC transporter ATP-binding protein, partial [Synechococcales cyanobacterium]